jgi:hypothetical protein
MPIGHSPIREDVDIDIHELDRLLSAIEGARIEQPRRRRVGSALREAADIAGRWKPSGETKGRRKSSKKS